MSTVIDENLSRSITRLLETYDRVTINDSGDISAQIETQLYGLGDVIISFLPDEYHYLVFSVASDITYFSGNLYNTENDQIAPENKQEVISAIQSAIHNN